MKREKDSLDTFDLAIIRTLAERGHIKNSELAESIGLSPSACNQRTVRLKRVGIINRYEVDFDLPKIAPSIRVMTLIMLERQNSYDYNRMNAEISKTPEIVRAYRISGEFDYVIETVASDYDHFRHVIEQFLDQGVAVKQYQSKIMQQNVKTINPAQVLYEYNKN